MFLVAVYWRGRLNVESMRFLQTEDEVIQELKKYERWNVNAGLFRVYLMSANDKPANMTKKFQKLMDPIIN